jgi:serine/threonine protein kinase
MDMEIIESNEAFKETDGDFKFHHISLLIRKDRQLYTAKCAHRFFGDQQPIFAELHDVKILDAEDRGPKEKPTWTVLDSPQDYYVKSPNWRAYELPRAYLEQHIHNEIEICELLKLHPHLNVALYAGCGVTNGRVSGLYFKKYTSTLAQRVNPHHANKEFFLTMDRRLSAGDDNESVTKACLDGILAGVRHLHSLGIVHNDITPSNIMFEEDGTPIIDFGSCRKIGESMKKVGTTYGWSDDSVETGRDE